GRHLRRRPRALPQLGLRSAGPGRRDQAARRGDRRLDVGPPGRGANLRRRAGPRPRLGAEL
ncbi:MAG: hypothetical protein AVDCRST_MAG40-3206, partial [uncultured Gemmatimonadaceae bacterium]